MKKLILFLPLLPLFIACSDDDTPQPEVPQINVPLNYSFERNAVSTIAFEGQTTRILMAEEFVAATKDFSASQELLIEMYRNETQSGGDADPFSNPSLNSATQNIKSKTASSNDLFSNNSSDAALIKADFETWAINQVMEVFPNQNTLASPAIPGQLADGAATRYVNAMGLEYDQMINKGLIGALMLDQILNNYLSADILDQGTNREDNLNEILLSDQNYTAMEHFWDEAYGYVYGTSDNTSNPNTSIGEDDSFINKYIGRMEGDEDYAGFADIIFEAFKTGRAAIVAGRYDIRDAQIAVLRNELSKMMAVRSVFYLVQGKNALPSDRNNYSAYGTAFHDLSEGYGFIYSLQFARDGNSQERYFTKSDVDVMLNKLVSDGPNGLWDVKPETLDELAGTISSKFNISIEQAGS